MKAFFTLIKLDYLQRTRSYAFIVTLCISLALAYTFVPEPNANYTTVKVQNYIGLYNAPWFGYVTAIMGSVFLSLFGFYLVNGSIQKDFENKTGQIISACGISNFKYLLSKVISNFLVLLSILSLVCLMSILLFFLYNDNVSFSLMSFIVPYLFIPIPALFLISSIAIAFEVILPKFSVLQQILFFFLFAFMIGTTPQSDKGFAMDPIGNKIVINAMEKKVQQLTNSTEPITMTIGFVVGANKDTKKFNFTGIEFPYYFMISRLVWIAFSLLLIYISSLVFHRFNLREKQNSSTSKKLLKVKGFNNISLSKLTIPELNFNIYPLIKTEFILLLRNGNKWLWVLNGISILLLIILPIKAAYSFVLPILWFLQVTRISSIGTKEFQYNMQYFSFSSYKPFQRVFLSQFIAILFLLIFISTPLIIKLLFSTQYISICSIGIGALFITSFATILNTLSKGRKLFEIIFFLLTYANLNGVPILDYLGAVENNLLKTLFITMLTAFFLSVSLLLYQRKVNNQ